MDVELPLKDNHQCYITLMVIAADTTFVGTVRYKLSTAGFSLTQYITTGRNQPVVIT